MATATDIRSEDDAWDLLRRALHEKDFDLEAVKFIGWPTLDIHLQGDKLHATLPSRYLPALIEFQEALERVFTHVRYKENNLRRLKDDERCDLEIVYSLKEGSTGVFSQVADALDRIAGATDKMTGKQIAITVCVLALLFASSAAWSEWLDHQETIAKTAQEDKLVSHLLEDNAEKTKQIERMRLMEQAVKASSYGRGAFNRVGEAHGKLINSMADDEYLIIGQHQISGRELKEAISPTRQKTTAYSHQGAARLLSVDSSTGPGYVVGVHMEGGGIFNARIETDRLTPEELTCVKDAIFNRTLIWVHIEGRLVRNRTVKDAYIFSARELAASERRLLASQ